MIKRLVVVDIDETLFVTKAKIYVKKNGKIVKELTNSEFNEYKLNSGEEFDFEQFKDTDLFVETSIPNLKMIDIVNKLQNVKNTQIVILTARNNMDDKEKFLNFFRGFGMNVGHFKNNQIHIIRSGELEDNISTAEKKKLIISRLINNNDFNLIEFYDDNLENLNVLDEFAEKGCLSYKFLVKIKENTIEKID